MPEFTKIIQLDEVFPETLEPTVQLIKPDPRGLIKVASSEAENYMNSFAAEPGKTYVLVLAMSAGEFYGPNRNGDAFAESPIPGVVEKGETLPDWHKSFESFAKVYKHHINKDPTKSMGDVVRSFYNWDMHRVELLLKLDNAKASDVVRRVNDGEYPAVSMGCKIKYDVCSVPGCHNKAAKRSEYCDHVKFTMNHVDPATGQQYFVWNPSPKLFDISFVVKPADRIGYMMKKVAFFDMAKTSSAELGESVDFHNEKRAVLKKLSEIDKIIQGQTAAVRGLEEQFINSVLPAVADNSPEMSEYALSTLSKCPLAETLAGMTEEGISPTIGEIVNIALSRAGVDQDSIDTLKLGLPGLQRGLLEMFSRLPGLTESTIDSGILGDGPVKVSSAVREVAKSYVEKRASLNDYVYRRAVGDTNPEQGLWQLQDIATSTGDRFQTTRKALEDAKDSATLRNSGALVGATAAGATLYKALTSFPKLKKVAPLMAGMSILGGKTLYDNLRVPNLPGTDVPANTEMKKVSSDSTELSSILSVAQEYNQQKVAAELPRFKDRVAFHHKIVKEASKNNLVLRTLTKLAEGIEDQEVYETLKSFEVESEHPAVPPTVDFHKVSEWLGEGLLKFVAEVR